MLSVSIRNSVPIPFLEDINNKSEYLIPNPQQSNNLASNNNSLVDKLKIDPKSISDIKPLNEDLTINSGDLPSSGRDNLFSSSKKDFSQFLKKVFPSEENDKLSFREIRNKNKF